jgi:hypothetical protein
VVLHAAVAEVAKAAKVAKLVELAKVAELAAVAEVVARQHHRLLATSLLLLSPKASHAARQHLRQHQQGWLAASRAHLAAVVLLAAVAEVVARQYQRWLATSWLHLSAKTSHAARQYLRQRQQR